MRHTFTILVLSVVLGGLPTVSTAQEPRDRGDDGTPATPPAKDNAAAVDAIVARLMAFDKNKDGKLTREEVVDERLLRLFDLADANKDGVVTKEELIVVAKKIVAGDVPNGGRRRGFGPPGGPGGFGPGGPGGFGGPPRPGQILPPFLQEELSLTADQKKQVALLQKEVDEKLDKLLTEQQRQQLKEMRQGFGRGPGGGPGGPPGRRRRGPDGPPGEERPSDRGPGGPPPDSGAP
ncbi:MAG TPA: EF-hand domain-containing protein [Planctomycetaceae bacterium]|nr:EF-hand domain-containing protein [Planctomycetaceae bacterium]